MSLRIVVQRLRTHPKAKQDAPQVIPNWLVGFMASGSTSKKCDGQIKMEQVTNCSVINLKNPVAIVPKLRDNNLSGNLYKKAWVQFKKRIRNHMKDG